MFWFAAMRAWLIVRGEGGSGSTGDCGAKMAPRQPAGRRRYWLGCGMKLRRTLTTGGTGKHRVAPPTMG